eukprot:TRINITY_DN1349_c0_g1_i7.p1 TRINITY_DN1349_c0_g1~~TRINITY_DN1349_c0_g1_i7.p1  ORF type:complete len:460 (-),score=112.83 TRINITY_DN1349_c0_g1_i7:4-1383(-)
MVSSNQTVYFARVMPMFWDAESSSPHLSHHLKFLVAKEDKNDLCALGGAWSKSKDGGDPSQNPSILIQTAIRTFRDYTNLDLTPVQRWVRFMVTESRPPFPDYPDYTETTHFFIPIFQPHLPHIQQLQLQHYQPPQPSPSETQQPLKTEPTDNDNSSDATANSESDPPTTLTTAPAQDTVQPTATPASKLRDKLMSEGGIVISCARYDCVTISLDGLLDYNESDKGEHTFEVSLFAELFHNMLQNHYGLLILKALEAIPKPTKEKKSGEEKKTEEEKKSGEEKKLEEEKKSEVKKEVKTEDITDQGSVPQPQPIPLISPLPDEMKDESATETTDSMSTEVVPTEEPDTTVQVEAESSTANSDTMEAQSTSSAQQLMAIDQPKPKKKTTVVDRELLAAFEYFDLSGVGYIRVEDMETILHCLGLELSRYNVRHLVYKVADSNRSQVHYKKITEQEKEIEE